MVKKMKLLKNKYQIILIASLMFVSFSFGYFLRKVSIREVSRQQITVVSNQKVGTEMKIEELNEIEHYTIKVYYPFTAYNDLNKILAKKMQEYVDEFLKIREKMVDDTKFYSLDISYDTYSYQDKVSYVFHITSNTGGAHPDTTMWTIVYDKKENQVITLESLIKKYPDLLKTLSIKSREQLKLENKDLSNNLSMLMDGTSEKIENFSNFAYSKQGLVLFFPRYQIAPYYLGEFHVVLPYQDF